MSSSSAPAAIPVELHIDAQRNELQSFKATQAEVVTGLLGDRRSAFESEQAAATEVTELKERVTQLEVAQVSDETFLGIGRRLILEEERRQTMYEGISTKTLTVERSLKEQLAQIRPQTAGDLEAKMRTIYQKLQDKVMEGMENVKREMVEEVEVKRREAAVEYRKIQEQEKEREEQERSRRAGETATQRA